jgi:hypothetical protein
LVVLVAGLMAVVAIAVIASRVRSRPVQPEELAKLIDRADRIVILQEPLEGSAVLYQSSERRDLDTLKAAISVERPERYMHCMCSGTPAIELYADGKKIGQITNHHAKLIRCSLWQSDAPLTDVGAFLRWFDDRDIPGPRKEYEAGLERDKEWAANEQKWLDAMPPALRPHWPAATRSFDPDLALLHRALSEQVPDKDERIRALFAWYGSGAGPWSGFPAYEDIAEKMLLDYPTQDLVAAVEGKNLTSGQTEGVARLFGGWTFSQLRPNDLRLLSPGLKAQLLKHSLVSPDEDKRSRARRAFGTE